MKRCTLKLASLVVASSVSKQQLRKYLHEATYCICRIFFLRLKCVTDAKVLVILLATMFNDNKYIWSLMICIDEDERFLYPVAVCSRAS